jgi:hypothetical protein
VGIPIKKVKEGSHVIFLQYTIECH